ncbi:MAG: HEAT repeat domain-containing protein [Anaerolineales bacterium]|nr:HEAT repeat domain-containing protein [Anaerolineales bacterium]
MMRQARNMVGFCSLLLGCSAFAGLDQDVRDPDLRQAYLAIHFERQHPKEVVQIIHETVRNVEPALQPLGNLAKDPRPEVRSLVALLLGELNNPAAADPLWILLEDQNDTVRWAAAGAIIRLNQKMRITARTAGLKHEDPAVRALVAATLRQLQDKSAEDPLIEALRDPVMQVRMEAAAALGTCGTSAAVPHLIPLLQDPSVQVRTAAAASLGKLGDPSAVQPLINALNDPDWHVRARSIMSLSSLIYLETLLGEQKTNELAAGTQIPGQDISREFIQKLRQDTYALVRDRAADALKESEDQYSVEALVSAIISDDREARIHAARALILGNQKSAIPLLMQHRHHPNPEVREKIIEVLGELGGESEKATIIEALQDTDEWVRHAAERSLARVHTRLQKESNSSN